MNIVSLLPGSRLVRFVFDETDRPLGRVLMFGVISGIAGALVLAAINHGAQAVGGAPEIQPLLLFAGLLGLFLYSKRYSLINAILAVEEMLEQVRGRVAEKVARSELVAIEKLGPSYIFNRLSQDTVLISDSAHVIFASFGALIMLVFATIYIAMVSFEGFLMTAVAVGLGVLTFISRRGAIIETVQAATRKEVEFLASVDQSLKGFKELKLNRGKALDILRTQRRIGASLAQEKKRAGRNQTFVMMFSQGFFYTLLGVVVFVWPVVMHEPIETVIKVSATILFIIGPIDLVVGSLPLFIEADIAVDNLKELERKLDGGIRTKPSDHVQSTASFSGVSLSQVEFQYPTEEDETTFKLGPIDLEINPREILFIVGGNGSGKSTLLKLITGLYYPDRGQVLSGGRPLSEEDYENYRQQFSAVFTDFYLFDRLYGISPVAWAEADRLLDWLEISKKTRFQEGRFTNLNLSTGQRKRLALIAAILEERPVLVFDEIAADQDPGFRRRFYEEILPELRNLGYTVVAVTHDDRYFSSADRILFMEEGRLTLH